MEVILILILIIVLLFGFGIVAEIFTFLFGFFFLILFLGLLLAITALPIRGILYIISKIYGAFKSWRAKRREERQWRKQEILRRIDELYKEYYILEGIAPARRARGRGFKR